MSKKVKVNMRALRRVILICAVIGLIAIVIMLMALTNPVENRINYIHKDDPNWSISKMPENVSPLFAKYNGTVSTQSIYKAMNLFVEDFIEEYYLEFGDDFDEAKIAKYYDNNALTIKRELGIDNKETFLEFVNSLKVLKGDELILKQYIIIPESIKQVTRGLKFVLAVDYENNERLLFDLKILNNSTTDSTPIEYSTSSETQYKDYVFEELPDTPIEDDTERSGKIF